MASAERVHIPGFDGFGAYTVLTQQDVKQLHAMNAFRVCMTSLLAHPTRLHQIAYQETDEPITSFNEYGFVSYKSETLLPFLRIALLFDMPPLRDQELFEHRRIRRINNTLLALQRSVTHEYVHRGGNRFDDENCVATLGYNKSGFAFTSPQLLNKLEVLLTQTDYTVDVGAEFSASQIVRKSKKLLALEARLRYCSFEDKVESLKRDITRELISARLSVCERMDDMAPDVLEYWLPFFNIFSNDGSSSDEDRFRQVKGLFGRPDTSRLEFLKNRLDKLTTSGRQPLIPE